MATASCAPSLPQDCEFVPLTCWAGLCAPALGPDGAPGWDSGLLELMSNWGSAETGSEVSGRAGLGGRGGWRLSRRRPRRPAGRARQRGRGWTPEQAVRLERGKTGWNRGTGRVEEREVRRERGWPCRDAGCLSTWAKIPGVPMPVDPGMSERVSFPPRLGGALFCQVPGRGGFGSSSNPPRRESALSGSAAAEIPLQRV